ncbi:MAG TPA: hypothetical protein VEU33_09785 [Archangium sp.]|nr:hypothetical protein [Archangium sp.]
MKRLRRRGRAERFTLCCSVRLFFNPRTVQKSGYSAYAPEDWRCNQARSFNSSRAHDTIPGFPFTS